MLCGKLNLRKKANLELWQVVMIALALFCAIVIIIIFGRKVMLSKNANSDCENNAGECVLPTECATCSNYLDCNAKYPFPCKGKDNLNKICCPGGDVMRNDAKKTT